MNPSPIELDYVYQAYVNAVDDLRVYGLTLEGEALIQFWEHLMKFEHAFMELTTQVAERVNQQSQVEDATSELPIVGPKLVSAVKDVVPPRVTIRVPGPSVALPWIGHL